MKFSMYRSWRDLRWPVLAVAVVTGAVTLTLFNASQAQVGLGAAQSSGPEPQFAVPVGTRSFADVIEEVSPAVVNIAVTKVSRAMPTAGTRRRGGGDPFEEFFGRYFGAPGFQGGAPAPRRLEGQGSGFLIDAAGYVATNNHVIDGAEEIVVTLASGQEFSAEVVGRDPQTDIALLKLDAEQVDAASPLPVVAFGDSDRTRVGDWVLAIGNPFGLGGTATAGIVSARGRDIASGPYDDYLQIDAPINSGNSGGPVFNAGGEVIGINTAIFSPNGGNIGIGFAIPANQASQVVAQLRDGGTVTRGWLGVQIQPVDDGIAGVLGLDAAGGALVSEIVEDSPAADGGLEVGDVVMTVDGKSVDSPLDLARIVAMYEAGTEVDVEVVRDGRSRTLSVEIGERSGERLAQAGPSGRAIPDSAAAAELGLGLEDLDSNTRNRLGLDAGVRGAIVTQVRPGSEASARGVRAGDVIVSVNRRPTPGAAEAAAALAEAWEADEQALVLLRRGDGQRFVALGAA